MKVKCLIYISIFVFGWLILNPTAVLAQAEMTHTRLYDLPTFHYDLVNVASPDSALSRLQLYLKIAFDELQFTFSEDRYQANYEVTAIIFDKQENQIDGRIEEEEVEAINYDLTNSRQAYSVSYLKFDLEPGEYEISLSVMDMETKKKRTIKDRFKLRDFTQKKLMVSDFVLVRNVRVDSLGVKSFHPDVADCIKDLSNELYVYYEIYSQTDNEDERFQISYSVKNPKGKIIIQNSYKRRKDGPRTLEFFPLAISDFSRGIYLLELKVKSGLRSDKTEKSFFIRWADMPSTISDIDLAIRQLKYIADKREYDKLKKASSDEKLERFEEYWTSHDPTPGTKTNEWMDEFYRRVHFTNENFTVFRDGWKTDMGMIYIIFGPPNDIERHPFDLETKPSEIWYYHDINKQFVFMDLSGFGEYRLLTTGWEAWRSSIRNKW